MSRDRLFTGRRSTSNFSHSWNSDSDGEQSSGVREARRLTRALFFTVSLASTAREFPEFPNLIFISKEFRQRHRDAPTGAIVGYLITGTVAILTEIRTAAI